MINYDEIKRTKLYEFALSGEFGYAWDKKHSTIAHLQARNSQGERCVFYTKPEASGHYTFANMERKLNIPGVNRSAGTIVDFLIDHYKGDEKQAKDYLISSFGTFKPTNKFKEYIAKSKTSITTVADRLAMLNNNKHITNDNYLLDRLITKQVISDYMRYGEYRASANPFLAIFPTLKNIDKDLNGKFFGVYKDFSPKSYVGKFKQNLGIPQGLLVLKKQAKFERVFICESPIDALSLECLHRKHAIQGERAYISTCGTISYDQIQTLKDLIPQLPNVTIALDNNDAGRKMTHKLNLSLTIPLATKFPKGVVDWNNVLCP